VCVRVGVRVYISLCKIVSNDNFVRVYRERYACEGRKIFILIGNRINCSVLKYRVNRQQADNR
jgi:hypothetical protein